MWVCVGRKVLIQSCSSLGLKVCVVLPSKTIFLARPQAWCAASFGVFVCSAESWALFLSGRIPNFVVHERKYPEVYDFKDPWIFLNFQAFSSFSLMMKHPFYNPASVLSDSGLFLVRLSVYNSSLLHCGLAFLSLNKPGTGQIPSLNSIISGFLCDFRKAILFPYNHTNKLTYFLKLQGQKRFKTRAGSFSGNLPTYSGIITSINSSSFTSVGTPSKWRQQFWSKG